jgi:hypothetical protein
MIFYKEDYPHLFADGGEIKEWENSMKKRNDIEFLRIEKTEALPNNKLMVYYAYNPVGKDEFKGTQISTDVIKYADGGLVENQINELYNRSNFIGNHQNWKLKLLEMLQDESIEAYNIYQSLTEEQKEELLQELFEMDNDMGSDGDGEMETSKENLNILLDGAKNGKKYR